MSGSYFALNSKYNTLLALYNSIPIPSPPLPPTADIVTTNTAQTITAVKTFSVLPQSSVVPTLGDQLVNKTYADATADNTTLSQVLTAGNTATNNIFLTGILSATDISGSSYTGSILKVNGSGSNGLVAIGELAASTGQGNNAIAIGKSAGQTNQATQSVAIGLNAGNIGQLTNAVAIGNSAGRTTQGIQTVAVGLSAGTTSQGTSSVAVGAGAGTLSQGTLSVAVGVNAGTLSQGGTCVAIGVNAGSSTQGASSVSVGSASGRFTQGSSCVAVGTNAGSGTSGGNFQGNGAVAIGTNAGQGTTTGQGANAIAIGLNAGVASQTAGSICLNASGTATNPNQVGCFIRPIRGVALGLGVGQVFYDAATFELQYSTT